MLTGYYGALAQLGARLNGIQKAVGSNPICSIICKDPHSGEVPYHMIHYCKENKFSESAVSILEGCKHMCPSEILAFFLSKIRKKESAAVQLSAKREVNLMEKNNTNAVFAGSAGCGKPHIWRCLKQIFPDMIPEAKEGRRRK